MVIPLVKAAVLRRRPPRAPPSSRRSPQAPSILSAVLLGCRPPRASSLGNALLHRCPRVLLHRHPPHQLNPPHLFCQHADTGDNLPFHTRDRPAKRGHWADTSSHSGPAGSWGEGRGQGDLADMRRALGVGHTGALGALFSFSVRLRKKARPFQSLAESRRSSL